MQGSKGKAAERPPNIHQRLAAVMAEVSGVTKDGRVKGGGNWTFASHDAVVRAVRPHFVAHGIVMTLSLREHATDGNRLEAIYAVRFTNIDDPSDFVEADFLGYGIDPSDKAPGKVISYVKKYAILVTLCLETGEDVDQTNAPHEPAGGDQPARRKTLTASEKRTIREACEHYGVAKDDALAAIREGLGRPVGGLADLFADEVDAVVRAIAGAAGEDLGEVES